MPRVGMNYDLLGNNSDNRSGDSMVMVMVMVIILAV